MKTPEQHKIDCHKKHNNFYDYSLWPRELTTKDLVKNICPEHGNFTQQLNSHKSGRGCPTCAENNRTQKKKKTRKQHIDIAVKKHGKFRYDYSRISNDVSDGSKVDIKCNACNTWFTQLLSNHKKGHGCSCNRKNVVSKSRRSTIDTIRNIETNRPNTFMFDKWTSEFIGSFDKPSTGCKKCGEYFNPAVNDLLRNKHNCPKCSKSFSNEENEVLEFIKSIYDGKVISQSFDIISPKQIDIYLPKLNLAIEYCGVYWHTEKFLRDRKYHKNKLEDCNNRGIRLITIFSNEWVDSKELVKNKLRSVVGVDNRHTVFARKTTITIVDRGEKSIFFNNNHIQGDGHSSINIGLQYDNELVACVGLKKKDNDFIVNRYATSHRVVGGLSKLLKYVQHNYTYDRLISFADLRWSDGNLYEQTGWKLDRVLPEDYSYFYKGKVHHKFNFRRRQLQNIMQESFDSDKTEYQNCLDFGIYRLWDCGKNRYIYGDKV